MENYKQNNVEKTFSLARKNKESSRVDKLYELVQKYNLSIRNRENTESENIDIKIQTLFKSIKNTANIITTQYLVLSQLEIYGCGSDNFKELYLSLNIVKNRIGNQSNLIPSILPLTNNLDQLEDEQKYEILIFLKKCSSALNQIKDKQPKETSNL